MIAQLVENVKTETSKWTNDTEGYNAVFLWQSGIARVRSAIHFATGVDEYIRKQAEQLSFAVQ